MARPERDPLKRPVRVGVIGAGPMGLRHGQSLLFHVRGAELATVADPREEAARRLAQLTPQCAFATSHRELLADDSIEAVVIAAPNAAHAGLIQESAEAGKHVFCEKPLALDIASADAALDAVDRNGVKLQIGFQRRFDAAYLEARRAIDAGELGAIELVVATTRDPRPPSSAYLRASGGLFLDTAIHDLDIIRFLTGLEAVEVHAMASTLALPASDGFIDTAATSLRLENGALAVITNSLRAVYGYDVRTEVLGSAGHVRIGSEESTHLRRYTSAGVSSGYVPNFLERFEDAYVRELQSFVECVALGRQPEASGDDGRAALVLALLAARSLRERRPVSIDEAS